MARWQILSPAEYAAFEAPPVFTNVERKRFFDLSPGMEQLLHMLRTPASQIGPAGAFAQKPTVSDSNCVVKLEFLGEMHPVICS